MVVFGSRGHVRDLGAVQIHHCPVCAHERPFHIVLRYRVWHVWFIFAFVTQRIYALSCGVCGRGAQLKAAEAETFIGRSPIPFMHRWGLALLAAIVGLCVVLAQLGML